MSSLIFASVFISRVVDLVLRRRVKSYVNNLAARRRCQPEEPDLEGHGFQRLDDAARQDKAVREQLGRLK